MEQIAAGRAAPGRRAPGLVRRSLLWRVMTLVVFGTVLVLAAFGLASALAVSESRDHALDERLSLAQAAAGHVDYVVRHNLEALDELALAEGFDLQDADFGPEQQALRRLLLGSVFSRGVYLTDAQGRLILAEPAGASRTGDDLGSIPTIAAALTANRPNVSGLTPGIGDGEPVVLMAAPVRDADGLVQGAVVGEIALTGTDLSEIIISAAPGRTGYAQVIDSEG